MTTRNGGRAGRERRGTAHVNGNAMTSYARRKEDAGYRGEGLDGNHHEDDWLQNPFEGHQHQAEGSWPYREGHMQEQGSSHGNRESDHGWYQGGRYPEVRLRNRGTDPDPMPPDQDPQEDHDQQSAPKLQPRFRKL